jgi:catechol 2,3-dioxygenase-like lactoylglutathione lyase family enzyme
MFTHVTVGSNDLARSRRFYDAIFTALGAAPGTEDAKGRLVYSHKDHRFLVLHPVDGEAAAAGNGHTVSFRMDSPEQADAWHAAGVANGGTTAEDPPGIRHATENRTLYLAYLRDPDGNKLCGLHKVSG